MKRLFQVAIVLGLIGLKLTLPQIAYACSGYVEPNPIEDSIRDAEVIVEAVITETDDAGKNAILHVTQYLSGGPGPEYLLLYDVDPMLAAVNARGYDTACTKAGAYDGRPDSRIGMYGYFALKHTPDGTYQYVSTEGPNFIGLDEIEGFEALVAELRADEPSEPEDTARPLVSPLLLTTSTGQQYMLPVDGGAPIPYIPTEKLYNWTSSAYPDVFSPMPACIEIGCKMYVPDRSLFAEITAENVIEVDYPYSDQGSPTEGMEYVPLSVEGQAFSFSPTGESLVVWSQDQMTVYMVSGTACPCYYAELRPSLTQRAQITLAIRPDFEPMSRPWELIRWSADGSTFTYSDVAGLWMIDVFQQRVPEMLIRNTAGEVPVPVVVSTSGRYVGYTFDLESHEWTTLDRLKGSVFSNALPSPDERYLAYFADAEGMFPPRPDVEGSQCYYLPCSSYETPQPNYFQWIERDGKLYTLTIRCGENRYPWDRDNSQANCVLNAPVFNYYGYNGTSDNIFRATASDVVDLAYEPRHGDIAYITASQRLFVNDDEISISRAIDEEIVELAWLPPLFYYRD